MWIKNFKICKYFQHAKSVAEVVIIIMEAVRALTANTFPAPSPLGRHRESIWYFLGALGDPNQCPKVKIAPLEAL